MTARQPLGMTPSAVALSPDQKVLVCRVLGCERGGGGRYFGGAQPRDGIHPHGMVSDSFARAAGRTAVLVLNGRGLQSYPNPEYAGPKTVAEAHKGDARAHYVGVLQTGTMSVIDPVTREALDKYTQARAEPVAVSRQRSDLDDAADDSVIVPRPDKPSPIEHVIYIVKENRTYDQVFGKIGKGNSDPSLMLFDETRRAESLQAGARVRAVRQFLRQQPT